MAKLLTMRQTGFKTDLVHSVKYKGEWRDLVFPGVVVESAVIFVAGAMNFKFWGVVKGEDIELRVNVAELHTALSSPGVDFPDEADSKVLANCVVLLRRK